VSFTVVRGLHADSGRKIVMVTLPELSVSILS
jgi:hypothetical protein